MNFRHLTIGAILIIIGVMILSPIDDLIILIPLSIVVGPEIFPLVMLLGALLTLFGVFLVGKSTLRHLGFVGRVIAKHPVIILGSVIVICYLVYWWLTNRV